METASAAGRKLWYSSDQLLMHCVACELLPSSTATFTLTYHIRRMTLAVLVNQKTCGFFSMYRTHSRSYFLGCLRTPLLHHLLPSEHSDQRSRGSDHRSGRRCRYHVRDRSCDRQTVLACSHGRRQDRHIPDSGLAGVPSASGAPSWRLPQDLRARAPSSPVRAASEE